MYLLALLVEHKAAFNEEALVSAGFTLVSKPQPKGIVGLVKNVQLKTNGVEDVLIVQCENDPDATIYHARISPDGSDWRWKRSNNTRTIKLNDLPQGQRLHVQMRLENTHGEGPWSGTVIGIIPHSETITSMHK